MRFAKFCLVIFLCLNGLLLALHLGHLPDLGNWLNAQIDEGKNTKRVTQQIQPNVVRIESSRVFLPSDAKKTALQAVIVASTSTVATPASASAASAATIGASAAIVASNVTANEKSSCLEIGPWSPGQLTAAKQAWQRQMPTNPLNITERREIAHWWVHLPARSSKAEADKKARELRGLGIKNFAVVDEADYPNTLSLGLFQTEARATAYLNFLRNKGVRSAVVTQRDMPINRAWLQFSNIAPNQEKTLRANLPAGTDQVIQACRT